MQDNSTRMQRILDTQKAAFIADGFPSATTRIDRLQRVYRMVGENQKAIIDACDADFGCHSRHQAQMSEIIAVMDGAQRAIKQLKGWMKPEKRKSPFPNNLLGAKARVEYVPKGVVGNLSTWNFPVYTALLPLIGIFAAGNRAMLKFSEMTPATGELMCQLIAQYFDETELVGITGGPEVGAAFAALPLDHIIFTGGTHIGRHILKAAADNLTPCTLELGGKSPVIVSRRYDITQAAERIMLGKALNQGQACLGPDYCFVPRESLEAFVSAAIAYYSARFPSILDNPDVTSVINERHHQRVMRFITDAREQGGDVREINPAHEDFSTQALGLHKIPMTLVIDPSEAMAVMQDEIFGPVMAIKPYDDINDCINYINAHPRPLGLYYFGNDALEERRVLDHTISGGVTINDVMHHSSCDDLPFGGIGPSGMGHYHGKDGFKTFSHARAIFKQTKVDLMKLFGMLPPYTDKCQQQLDNLTQVKK
jgi:coniferyl-aldehyde dehydrogenase